jgi:hypothetical protein
MYITASKDVMGVLTTLAIFTFAVSGFMTMCGMPMKVDLLDAHLRGREGRIKKEMWMEKAY